MTFSIPSANGVASLLLFRSKTPDMLKLTDNTSDFDMTPVAQMIKRECFESLPDRDSYRTRLFQKDATDACSDLFLSFLAKISSKRAYSNTALMIGNITTSVVIKLIDPLF